MNWMISYPVVEYALDSLVNLSMNCCMMSSETRCMARLEAGLFAVGMVVEYSVALPFVRILEC